MLIKRIVTAVVLLAILLPALFFAPPGVFNAITLVLIAAGVWEWSRINGCAQLPSVCLAVVTFLVAMALSRAGAVQQTWLNVWLLVSLVWVLGAAYLLQRGVGSWAHVPQSLRLVLGVVMIGAAWLAVAQLREMGINLLLSVLLLVWAADVCAYVVGKLWGTQLFGGRKLAVTISPGKTWAGVLGGMLGVLLVAGFWIGLDSAYRLGSASIYTLLWTRWGWWSLVALVFLTTLAVVGDLIESLVKRSAGVKDSSGLLPGHGGVLDRVDALLPVLPLAMLIVSLS